MPTLSEESQYRTATSPMSANRFALRPRSVPPTIPVCGSNGLYKRRVFDLVSVDPWLTEGEDVALNRAMEAAGLSSRTLAEVIVEHRETKSFIDSLRWLFKSGMGASRQLARYRQIRLPDLVLAGQLSAVFLGVTASRRGVDRRIAWSDSVRLSPGCLRYPHGTKVRDQR